MSHRSEPLFQTPRLFFTPIEAEDGKHDDMLLRMQNSIYLPNAGGDLPRPHGKDKIKELRKRFAEMARVALYICLREDKDGGGGGDDDDNDDDDDSAAKESKKPTAIGILMLFNRDGNGTNALRHSKSEIGINLTGAHVDKGYGSEAIEWMTWYGFSMVGLHRLGMTVNSWNAAARRCYERAVFQVEGVEREAIWYLGAWHDLVKLSMLEPEWRHRMAGFREQVRQGWVLGMEPENRDTAAVGMFMGCS